MYLPGIVFIEAEESGAEKTDPGQKEERGDEMKSHRFWAWAMVLCTAMTLYTGYKRK
ncbi:MAG: hypothetical protein ACLVAI_01930 [Anaerovoracaceae bacterium]